MPKLRLLVVLAFAAVSTIWGSTYLAIRVALESFPPFALGALRFVAAGALLLALARARGEAWPKAREWRSAAVTGVFFFVIGNGLVNVGQRSVSSGLASVLVATMPLWAALVSRLLGERSSRLELVSIVLGLAGVAVLNMSDELRASPHGTIALVLAPLGWALGSVATQRMALPATTLMRTAAQMLSGGGAMLLVSALLGERVAGLPSPRALWAIGYLVVFGSVIGFSAYVFLLENVRASLATSYAYLNPLVAIALGMAWGGERLDATSGLGALIVVCAVFLLLRARGGASGELRLGGLVRRRLFRALLGRA